MFPRHGRLRSGWYPLPAVQCGACDLAVPDQEVDPGAAIGDQAVQRRGARAKRRGPARTCSWKSRSSSSSSAWKIPARVPNRAEHRSLAQACAFGQPVHGQLAGPLPGDHLARRDQQKPPVAGGVGALYVGSPETVAQKIATNLRALGATRFELKYGMPGLTHDQLMTNTELYGRQVVPRVRELLS